MAQSMTDDSTRPQRKTATKTHLEETWRKHVNSRFPVQLGEERQYKTELD